jgi:hypothetical protein
MRKLSYILFLSFIFILNDLCMGQSGKEYRKTGLHNGNRVKTVFGNWGVIGQPANLGHRGSWIYDNNGYLGDVSLFVGAEIRDPKTGITFHSVVTCPVDRPTKLPDESPGGKKWTFEPVTGYDNPKAQKIAMSTDQDSWPQSWPDKKNDVTDPGWPGSWNGYFGKKPNADQESIFVMDDNNDERFNFAQNNIFGVAYKPMKNDPTRNGLGLEVKVRGLQWAQFLAQDNIFWLYEITNHSDNTYDRVVFGMLVGTYVGVTSTENFGEYDDDWSFFDVTRDITYTGDFDKNASRDPFWTGPVGMVGYSFLESPGNPYDGIDNDRDSWKSNRVTKAPFFKASDFDSVSVKVGDTLIVIDTNFNRSKVVVDATPRLYSTRGFSLFITPGVTKLAEGNMIKDASGKDMVNPNAYDGADNDFDGLIDENYQLHYRQVRVDRTGVVLFDMLNPTTYKDFKHGIGLDEKMIDERRDNNIDDDDDWNPMYDDVGADGIANTGDFGENDGIPTHGEPNYDETDVHESDQIGLTSFQYFTPAGDITLADKEDLWKRLSPGYFDVPKSIINGVPQYGEDGDFIYGTGYFPLLSGKTERLSLALVYGGGLPTRQQDLEDLLKHRETVQKIYNSNYRFPQPPDKPTLTVVPGDHQVTLYWDRKSEYSFDPVLRVYNFEGYKIYRATDPNFNDISRITDANGIVIGFIPLAQFDVVDSIKGYFRANPDLFQDTKGYSFYLGSDNGLQHSFIDDQNVENGRKYYYALVAYSKGDERLDVLPSENTKFISILPDGRVVTDINTALVTPNAEKAGYIPPPSGIKLEKVKSDATGEVYYQIVDSKLATNNTYEVTFDDTRSLNEYVPFTIDYSVKDLGTKTETFTPNDTFLVKLKYENIIWNTVILRDENGSAVQSSNYTIDTLRGKIKASKHNSMNSKSYTISYQYYPVFKSPYLLGSPYAKETKDADIFDGVQIAFNNHWQIKLIDSSSGWNTGTRFYNFTFSTEDIQLMPDDPSSIIKSYKYPSDYEIRFASKVIDTSSTLYESPPIPTNFTVWNVTDNRRVEYVFSDDDNNGRLSPFDKLLFFEKDPRTGKFNFTWQMIFTMPLGKKDMIYTFTDGDLLRIHTTKAFRNGDKYRFTPTPATVNNEKAKSELDMVKVVPNPYVAATTHEAPLPPGITSGRGTRKIDFIHVPANATIDIFTSRGEHVITLNSNNSIFDGSVSWNLKSKENLDVAYGVYFYVIDSPVGKKSGKIAIIK